MTGSEPELEVAQVDASRNGHRPSQEAWAAFGKHVFGEHRVQPRQYGAFPVCACGTSAGLCAYRKIAERFGLPLDAGIVWNRPSPSPRRHEGA